MEFKAVLRNRTGIEDWIVEKANDRLENIFLYEQQHRQNQLKEPHVEAENDSHALSAPPSPPPPKPPTFLFPYDLGWRQNCLQVINWNLEPTGDGLYWQVRPGCDQYTLTREQLLQKAEKRDRTIVYHAVREYSGSFFPISFGPRALWGIPCTDEHRLALQNGDEVRVTRWKHHWLYGEKGKSLADMTPTSGGSRDASSARKGGKANGLKKTEIGCSGEKGWFPRLCVAEVSGCGNDKKQS